MRRLVVAVVLLAALVAASGGVARSRPTITVTRVVPLIVKGSGFVVGERVKVAVREPAVYRKTVTAGRLGRFTATFRVALGKCVRIRVVATGNKGSRASDTVPPSCTV
jgi:uncharacterized protein (DUF58 family)